MSSDFLGLLCYSRLIVHRKEATQIFGLRGSLYYLEGYFCTWVILPILFIAVP